MNRTQDHRAGDGADYRGADYRGAGAEVRPARAADLPALCDFFTGLSMQTRYLRFFSPVTPGPALLHLLAGGAGTTDAVLATRGAAILGHAMATDRTGPDGTRMTDIGVVVADAWQGQGVGSALVRALITRAQARGVTSVAMDVLHGNHQVHAMIAAHWPAARTGRGRDYAAICVQLPQRQQYRQYRQPRQQVRPAPSLVA